MNPWYTLCVDLIGPSTLKEEDKTEIDFMCLTIIDAVTGWFKVVELPIIEKLVLKNGKVKCQKTFDKISTCI